MPKKREFDYELTRILATADRAYGDGLVASAADGDDPRDGLAEFIAEELIETYDDDLCLADSSEAACEALAKAVAQLEAVMAAIAKLTDEKEATCEDHT